MSGSRTRWNRGTGRARWPACGRASGLGLRPGVNVANGKVTHPAVAEGVGMEFTPVDEALGAAQRA